MLFAQQNVKNMYFSENFLSVLTWFFLFSRFYMCFFAFLVSNMAISAHLLSYLAISKGNWYNFINILFIMVPIIV